MVEAGAAMSYEEAHLRATLLGVHLVENACKPVPVPKPDVPEFRKIDEESLRAIELAADEICAECGLSATAQCNVCPLDTLFARIG